MNVSGIVSETGDHALKSEGSGVHVCSLWWAGLMVVGRVACGDTTDPAMNDPKSQLGTLEVRGDVSHVTKERFNGNSRDPRVVPVFR